MQLVLHTCASTVWCSLLLAQRQRIVQKRWEARSSISRKVAISTCLLHWRATGLNPTLVLLLKLTSDMVRRDDAVGLIVRLQPNFLFRSTTLTKTKMALMIMALMILTLAMTMLTPMMT